MKAVQAGFIGCGFMVAGFFALPAFLCMVIFAPWLIAMLFNIGALFAGLFIVWCGLSLFGKLLNLLA